MKCRFAIESGRRPHRCTTYDAASEI